MRFKKGDPVILTDLKYAGRDSDDIADVVIFPSGAKIGLFETHFGPSSLVSASALEVNKEMLEVNEKLLSEIMEAKNLLLKLSNTTSPRTIAYACTHILRHLDNAIATALQQKESE